MTTRDRKTLPDLTPRQWTAEQRLRMAALATSASLNLEGFDTTPERLLADRERLKDQCGKRR